ncbi:MAG: hypothetical protein ABID38_01935 [Candidatus Diapherotrites archaeon]
MARIGHPFERLSAHRRRSVMKICNQKGIKLSDLPPEFFSADGAVQKYLISEAAKKKRERTLGSKAGLRISSEIRLLCKKYGIEPSDLPEDVRGASTREINAYLRNLKNEMK